MRLIDADALIAQIEKRLCHAKTIVWLCRIIGEVPTIEAEPVRHGAWNIRTFDLPREGYYCSECGTVEWRTSRFCPNCGAKMDGGAKE